MKNQNSSRQLITIIAMMFLYAMISFVTNLAAPVGKIWGASFEDPAQAERMGMLGNLFKESGVTDRLSDTAQNAMCNTVTIMLGVAVGGTAVGQNFLSVQTLLIIGLGLAAFAFATIGGLIIGDIMYFATKGKINPLIGAAGVSAVPMAARVASKVGQKENPSNFLLMHAMGPNVAGVIGSAIAAGILLTLFG